MAKYSDSSSFQLQDWQLKDVLARFPHEAMVELVELADTWHPASGFVDETFFQDHLTISDWLAEPYDFKGLLSFRARIGEIELLKDGSNFIISGNPTKINELKYGPFFEE